MLILFGTLAFVLEVVAWVALARWGWQIHPLLAAAFLLAFILFWGDFLSPKASFPVLPLPKAALQTLLFAFAAYGAGQVWGKSVALGFFVTAGLTIFAALALGLTATGDSA